MAKRIFSLPSKSLTYVRNVGRSLGYAVKDITRENNEYVFSLFETSKDIVQDSYSTVKDWFSNKSDTNIFDTGKTIIKDLAKNTIDDIKTGNWYNKERDQVFDDNLAKMMGFDFGDFNLDFDDFGDELDSSMTEESKAIITQDVKNTQATIMTIDETGRKVASTVNKGIAASADYIVSASRAMNEALYNLNKSGFGSVTTAIADLNRNAVNIGESIGRPLTTHIQNSTMFFTKTTETLNRMDQSLQQIVKNTTPAQAANSKSGSGKKSLGSFVDGTLDINGYLDFVKGNIKEFTDIFKMFVGSGSAKGGGNLKNIGKGLSPMQWVVKGALNSIIPEAFKEAQKEFNENLKNLVTGLAVKGTKNARKKGILGFIADMLLPEDDLKLDLRTNAYVKGPVAWDGIARKALVEVIPTTLFKIYSAITGAEGFTYDYNAGKFVSRREISSRKDERFKESYRRAGGNLYRDSMERAKGDKKTQDALEEFFKYAFTNNEDYFNILSPGLWKKSDLYKIITPEAAAILKNLIGGSRNNKGRRGKYNNLISDITKGRARYSDSLRNIEAAGDDAELSLYNNSDSIFKGRTGRFVDEFNHDSLFYLRGIYENTMNLGSGKGKKKKNNKVRSTSHETTRAEANANVLSSNPDQDIAILERLYFEDGTEVNQNDEDEMERYRKEQRKKNARDRINDTIGDVTDRIDEYTNNTWVGKLKGKIRSVFNAPFNAVTRLLNTLTDSMTSFLWGDGKTDKGFFGQIASMASKKFNEIIGDPLKNLFNKLFGTKNEEGKREGGALQGFWSDTKAALGDYWKWMGTAIREPILQAFNGRKVTKTGLIAASAGELVLPSELNPNYHGTNDKKQQMRKENQAIRNFYGAYAPGGTVGEDANKESETKSDKSKSKTDTSTSSDAADGMSPRKVKKIQSQIDKGGDAKNIALNSLSNGKDKVTFNGKKYVKYSDGHWEESSFKEGSIGSAIGNAAKEIADKAKNFASSLFGDDKKEEMSKKINEFSENIVPEIGKAKGNIGAGAIVGGLGGAILGGPILGMFLGAAAGFVSKSEKAQEMLFGPKDKDGNREGGLINAKLSNFLEKNAPEMLKFGSVGALAGTLFGPVGLVGGLALGSITGYIKSSKTAQDALFGKLGEDGTRQGGIIPKELQDRFKKSKGSMLLGAGLGLLAGPFGLFGNIAVGAGLGFLSENEKVHRFLFGGEDKNGKKKEGLLPKIGDKIFGSINDIFHNMGNRIKNWLKDTGKKLKNRLTKLVSNLRKRAAKNEALGRVRTSPLTKALRGVAKYGGLGALGLLLGPIGALGLGGGALALNTPKFISNKIRKGNAANGSDMYGAITDENGNYILDENGKKIKRNFTAAERIRYRKNNMHVYANPKKNVNALKWNKFDTHISKLDKSELNKLKEELSNYSEDDNTATKIAKNKALEEFYNGCDQKINDRQMEKLAKFIMDGDYKGAERYITETLASRDNFTEEDLNHYIDLVYKCAKIVEDAQRQHKDTKKKLRELGLNYKNIGRAQGLIDTELKSERMSHEEVMEKYTGDQASDVHEILEILKDPEGHRKKEGEADTVGDSSTKSSAKDVPEEGAIKETNGRYFKRVDGKWKRISKAQYQVESASQKAEESVEKPIENFNDKLSRIASEGPIFKDDEKAAAAKALGLYYNGGTVAYGQDSQNDRIKYKWDSKSWIKDDKDKATRDETERADTAERSSIRTAETLAEIKDNMSGGFFSNSDDNKKEKEKEGLLSKIFGEEGLLSGLLGKISGSIFGGEGLLSKLFSGVLTPLLIGSFLTDIWTRYLEFNGATEDKVEHAKTDGSLITAGVIGAKLGTMLGGATLGAGLGVTAAGGILMYEMAESAADITNFESGRVNKTEDDSKDKEKTIKVTETDSRTKTKTVKEYKAYFDSVTEFLQYCKANPDAKNYYTNNPESIVIYVTNKNGSKIDVVDGYILNLSKLTSSNHFKYKNSKFRGYDCYYYVTKEEDEIKELVPNSGDRGILNRDIAIRCLVKKPNGSIIVGTTWGNTSLTFGEDNTHWSHSYVSIDMNSGVGTSVNYRDEESLVYILSAGRFTEANLEQQYMSSPSSIMDNIDRTLSTNGCYYAKYLGGKEIYTDIVTRKEYTPSSYHEATWDGSIKYKNISTNQIETIQEAYTQKSTDTAPPAFYPADYFSEKNGWTKVTPGKGSGLIGDLRGKSTGFVSQKDGKYAKMPYGTSTVGDAGCAPATATMLSKYYGKSLSMSSAVQQGQKYANSDGTSTKYFADVLGKQGINTSYIAGSDIGGALATGHPVALIGKDPTNTSKKNSPFGPINHYVMAEGFDKSGNVIINDPEMGHTTKYNPSILNKATMGIATGLKGKASGIVSDNISKVFGNKIPVKCQYFSGNLVKITYSDGTDEVTSKDSEKGKLANEICNKTTDTTVDTAIFNGKTPVKCQYFSGNLVKITYSDGSEEVTSKDSEKGKAAQPIYDATYAAYLDQNNNTTTEETQDENLDFLSKLYNAISTAFTGAISGIGEWMSGGKQGDLGAFIDKNILNINNGSTNLSDLLKVGSVGITGNTGTDYLKYMSSVPGGNNKQKELVAKMKSIEKGSNYSQEGPRDPSKGSADCSSTVNWVYKQVLGTDIGNNTDAMINSSKTVPVDMPVGEPTKSGGLYNAVTNSPGPDLSRLEPGDILLYSNSKGVNTDRKYRVSHVEMYMGNDQTMGHTGSPGPTAKTASTYRANQYIMARRLANIRDFDNNASNNVGENNTLSGSGSGINNFGSSNYSKPVISNNLVNTSMINTNRKSSSSSNRENDLLEQLVGALVNLISDMSNGRGVLSENVSKIAINSDNLAKMAELVNAAKENTKTSQKPTTQSKKVYTGLEGDDAFRSTVSQVAAWAKG